MYTPCDHFPDLMINDCRDILFVSKSFVIKHDCVFVTIESVYGMVA